MNNGALKARSIDVMIGLPHLSDGKLLDRARRLQQPVLVSANVRTAEQYSATLAAG